MLLSYPPNFVKRVYPSLIWKIKTNKKRLFLTFDDGPTPGVTNRVLDLLVAYQAKATFFCLGKNIEKEPDLYRQILEEQHCIGNHTFHHKNGWKNTTPDFVQDVYLFDKVHNTKIFRPPYGRLKTSQIKLLKNRYKIIMWSILTQDYDQKITPQKCAELAKGNWEKGSILVFHDSVKAERNMLFALEEVLEKAKKEGWECCVID